MDRAGSSQLKPHYNSYASSLEREYGYRIYRVGVDAGFSCPNRDLNKGGGCVYCDSQGASSAWLRTAESTCGKDFIPDIDSRITKRCQDIELQIERGIEFLKRRYKAEHFSLYFQAFSNTFAQVKQLEEIYSRALSGRNWDEFIVSTRPDCLDDEKLALLDSYNSQVKKVCLELGLQSGDDSILKAMNRGHDVDCFLKACDMAKHYNLSLCIHLLFGFPGEGKSELDKTIAVINKVHPQAVKIHNLNIVAGTKLYEKYLKGGFEAPSAEEHIKNTSYFLQRIPDDVVIERLICETPAHRLASPRNFPDKNTYLKMLDSYMSEQGAFQGDLYEEEL